VHEHHLPAVSGPPGSGLVGATSRMHRGDVDSAAFQAKSERPPPLADAQAPHPGSPCIGRTSPPGGPGYLINRAHDPLTVGAAQRRRDLSASWSATTPPRWRLSGQTRASPWPLAHRRTRRVRQRLARGRPRRANGAASSLAASVVPFTSLRAGRGPLHASPAPVPGRAITGPT